MIRCAIEASLTVDGETLGVVPPNEFKRFAVLPGEHAVQVRTTDGSLGWNGVVRVPAGEQVLLEPTLLPTDPTVGVPSSWQDADGTTYRTIRLNQREWFAENYKRRTGSSRAPAGSEANVERYGRLYNWKDVTGGPGNGWRLASRGDYESLIGLYEKPYEALIEGGKSGFDARFAGWAESSYAGVLGQHAAFWTSTPGPGRRDGGGTHRPTANGLLIGRPPGAVVFDDRLYAGPTSTLLFAAARYVRDL